ncbi:DUF2147 domain-containing protein [Ekhidna sp.]|uniref:DUF2147 domain-containing protein n=1 Tax=Ekhidna sp. TaxID=2608089 RepID=UPI0032EAAD36
MRIKLISILLLYMGLTVNTIAQKRPDSIVGKWVSSDDVRTVRVFKEDNTYKADIIKSNNPDEIGKLILWNLVYDADAMEWNNGQIKLPGMAHEVECYIKMMSLDLIKITGYHGLRVLGKSELYYKSQ